MNSDQTLGRLLIMGYVINDAVGDYREYQASDKTTLDKAEYAWEIGKTAGATLYVFYPMLKAQMIGTTARVSSMWVLARANAVLAPIAPVAVGYAIGAVVGTAISQQLFGDEGAQAALGFYSAGLLPGTEAPDLSNFQYIFKPTAPGGPTSLYDLAEGGIQAIKLKLRQLQLRRENRNPKYRGLPLPFLNL